MSFTGNEGSPISRETAKKWTKNYEDAEIDIESGKTVIKAHFFGKEKILKLLNQENCIGMRIYYAKNDNGDKQLLLVGAKSDQDDILPTDMQAASEEENIILDKSTICPPYCANNSI